MLYLDTLSDLLENTGLNDKSIIEFDMLNSTYDFSDYYLEENTPSINRITFDSASGDYSIKFKNDINELKSILTENHDSASTKYEVITKDLRNPFILEGSDITNVHVYFDTAIYSLTREQLETKDIEAIGSLLHDMYDYKGSKTYFDFNAKKNEADPTSKNKDFRDFINEGHSTKGILDLLNNSTIYYAKFNFDGTDVKVGEDTTKTTFASKGLVFNNIMEVTVKFGTADVKVSMASNFEGANKYEKAKKYCRDTW